MKESNGVVPVMLTPFNAQNEIDRPDLDRLIEGDLQKGVDVMFAVCQSSEMQCLSLEERAAGVFRRGENRRPRAGDRSWAYQ